MDDMRMIKHRQNKDIKMSVRHIFLERYSSLADDCDQGGLSELLSRYKEFYGHVEKLGKNLAEYASFRDMKIMKKSRASYLMRLFRKGFALAKVDHAELDPIENFVYQCGNSVRIAVDNITPEPTYRRNCPPMPKYEKILSAFRCGLNFQILIIR
jgi:hypothetical protein